MVNVLMLSGWHVHAKGYANFLQSQSDVKITSVWDDDIARGQEWAKELNAAFEPNLDKALARSDVDAVVVGAPTTDHGKVMVAAANAKKHIFTEKALATTVSECKLIADAVAKNGVKFCISYPQLTESLIQYAKKVIDEGLLGRVSYCHIRNSHDGTLVGRQKPFWFDVTKTGGGAMMDLGCHPMYQASYLFGKPKRISSTFNTSYCPPPSEDNAVSVIEFENNIIAVIETSFITPYLRKSFEIIGSEGAIARYEDNIIRMRSNKINNDGWLIIDEKKLPSPLPMPLRIWLDGIIDGKPIPFDTARGTALSELLENAYISHNEQKIVSVR